MLLVKRLPSAPPSLCVIVSVVYAALTVCLFGCGGSSLSGSTVRSSNSGLSPRNDNLLSGRSLPLDAYTISGEQQALKERAQFALASKCMARFGFDVPWPVRGGTAGREEDHLYGLLSRSEAGRYGYHGTQLIHPTYAPSEQGKIERIAHMSAAEVRVLMGNSRVGIAGVRRVRLGSVNGVPIPENGCLGEAANTLGSDDESVATMRANPDSASLAQGEIWQASKADPAVVAVVRRWSRCLAEHGYRAASPLSVGSQYIAQPRISPAEIALARTDVTCKVRTRLVDVWFAVESHLEATYVQQHIVELKAEQTRVEAMMQRVVSYLGPTSSAAQ